ncbi:hypothetical protein [Paenibacillus oleatilyticus]|uniref:Uncharacterized protein n=1 Tax=Paenibacillus oleatilyticus TaxID=2594886 RepID=A0ABV4VA69_9BACL
MKRTILPILHPPLHGHLYNAFPLSICPLHKNFCNWFYPNFSALKVLNHDHNLDIVFDTGNIIDCPRENPILDVTKINNKDILNVDFINTMKYYLDQSKYIYIFLDEYYVKNRVSYQQEHFLHETLIYGYDDQFEEFLVCGFNSSMIYGKQRLPYSCIHEGFVHNDYVGGWAGYTYLITINSKLEISFDKQKLVNYLEKSLSLTSENYTLNGLEKNVVAYGVFIYEYLESVFFNEYHKMKDPSVIRNSHVLWEYHNCMVNRIKFLHDSGYLNHGSEVLLGKQLLLEENAKKLRNIILKSFIKNDEPEIKNLIYLLQSIRSIEENNILDLLSQLKIG